MSTSFIIRLGAAWYAAEARAPMGRVRRALQEARRAYPWFSLERISTSSTLWDREKVELILGFLNQGDPKIHARIVESGTRRHRLWPFSGMMWTIPPLE